MGRSLTSPLPLSHHDACLVLIWKAWSLRPCSPTSPHLLLCLVGRGAAWEILGFPWWIPPGCCWGQ